MWVTDYDAPLSEAGDLTPKYYKTQQLILDTILKPQGLSLPDIIVKDSPKKSYGDVVMKERLGWTDVVALVEPQMAKTVLCMESLDINNQGGQSFGFILYQKKLNKGGTLTVQGYVRDRAQVLVDGLELAVLDCHEKDQEVEISSAKDSFTLDILVENLGRVNFCDFNLPILNEQRKGILGNILLSGDKLSDWQIYPLEFKKPFLKKLSSHKAWSNSPSEGPCLCRGMLVIEGPPQDTFLNMQNWSKGVVFINEFNLGRYWSIGPQKTLYIPAPILKEGINEILIFELHTPGDGITFEDKPNLG